MTIEVDVNLNVNKIAKPIFKKTYVEFRDGLGYDKELAELGLQKGDIIVFRGNGDPVRLPAGNTGNKMLITDPTSETGWTLVDAPDTTPAVFENGSGYALDQGMIVSVIDNGKVVKASATSRRPLYIVSEHALDGESVTCYGVPGTITYVRCTSSAVAVGDKLKISQTNGLCDKKTGSQRGIGVALTAKATGSVGLVKALLLDSMADDMESQDNSPAILWNPFDYPIPAGSVVTWGGGATTMALADENDDPILFTSEICPASGNVACYGVPGTQCYALCSSGAVTRGDKLTPQSAMSGDVMMPTGKLIKGDSTSRNVAIALEDKSSGDDGLVKVMIIASEPLKSSVHGEPVYMYNSGNTAIPRGTVVEPMPITELDRTRLRMTIAGDDSASLYVTSEDCASGENVLCYGVPGTICYALCNDSAVAVGDKLYAYSSVTPIDNVKTPTGMFTKGSGYRRSAAIALEAKGSGGSGLVKVLLTESAFGDNHFGDVISPIPGTIDSPPFNGDIYLDRVGNIVTITISEIYLNAALSSSNIQLYTLPFQYRPDHTTYFTVGSSGTAGAQATHMAVWPSGKLIFHKGAGLSTWPTDVPIRGTVTYITHK